MRQSVWALTMQLAPGGYPWHKFSSSWPYEKWFSWVIPLPFQNSHGLSSLPAPQPVFLWFFECMWRAILCHTSESSIGYIHIQGHSEKLHLSLGFLGVPSALILQDIFVQHASRPLQLLKAPQLHVLIIQLYLPSQITQTVWDKLLMFETEPKTFFMHLHPYKTHSSIWGGRCWKDLLCLWVSFP